MLRSLLYTVSQIISLYSFLCLIRIVLSWIPSAANSSFGQILSSLCDPYLNWFRRFPFTRIGMIDFSPILALGVLSVGSDMIARIIRTGHLSLWGILISLLMIIWSFLSFIFNLLIIFLIVRLLYDLLGASNNSPFWYSLDRFLNPAIAKITSFIPARAMSYRTRIIASILILLLLRIAFGFFFGSLSTQFQRIILI